MAAATIAGLSSLGIKLGYAVETTAGTAPDAYTLLDRINNIAGIALTPETIDASALEDYIEKSVQGRQSAGGTWNITVNLTSETIAQWNTLITASQAGEAAGKATWFEVYHPSMADAFFVKAQVPKNIPMPEMGQNSLLTVEIGLTITSYEGLKTAIVPTSA